MKASQLEKELNKALGDAVLSSKLQERVIRKKHKHSSIWIRIKKEALRDAVKKISEYHVPQLSVISGTDLDKNVELLYHFCIGHGETQNETVVVIALDLPKTDLTIPTITDLVPGASLTEREKQEFFGIDVIGLKDKRRAFLSDDLAKAHPWINNDKETAKFARDVHNKVKK